MSLYAKHVKSHLSNLLAAVGNDVTYERGSGTSMYYRNGAGSEVEVLDLLGGYGALILGHNHPELISEAQEFLRRGTVVHAQFSLRERAGLLAERLSRLAARESNTPEGFNVTFSNSGAESVEVALKHAELERGLKLEKLLEDITLNIELVREAMRRGEAKPSETIYEHSDIREQVFDVRNFDELIVGLINHNSEQLAKRPVFLALEGSFHGKLMGSVQLTYNKNFRRPFQAFGLKARFIPMNRAELLEQVLREEQASLFDIVIEAGVVKLVERPLPLVTALLVEPIQGEGGIRCMEADFARALRRAANEHGFPLIIDEIQSGLGRSGSFFASAQIGLRADYYTLSKALGGGLAKIGATLIKRSRFKKEFELIHSSTFAEDEFSCTIANKVLALLEANDGELYGKVRHKGERLMAALERVRSRYPDVIKEVRGKGLFLGVELFDQADAASTIIRSSAYTESLGYLVSGYLLREHAIRVAPTGSAPNVLRLEPSAFISDDEILRTEQAFDQVARILRAQDSFHLIFPLTNPTRKKPRLEVVDRRPAAGASANPPAEYTRPVRKVAFLNHLITPEWLAQVDPSLSDLSLEERRTFVLKMERNKRSAPYDPVRITSPLGSAVDFILYPLCVCSEQMARYIADGDLALIREDIADRIAAAKEDGCEVAGLGMYTSIVTNNCTSLRVSEIALTSGNALTVAMGIEAIERAAHENAVALSDSALAVIGAAGNIASTYSAILAARVPRVLLVGSEREGSSARLKRTVWHIYDELWRLIVADPKAKFAGITGKLVEEALVQRWLRDPSSRVENAGQAIANYLSERYAEDPFVRVVSERVALQEAQVVLAAANHPEPFLRAEDFRDGAIVCDIAVPQNVLADIATRRPDVRYMQGGIVATPNGESLHPGARAFLGAGQLFACMAEAAVLGLAGMRGHYSYGQISSRQVWEIAALARAHGFRLADYKAHSSL